MPLSFPLNPSTGTSYSYGGRNFIYNGERWGLVPVVITGPTGYTGSQGEVGPQGPAGTSVTIEGSTSTYASLPFPFSGTTGTGYILSDTGHLAVWGDGTWTDVGNITGPIGYTGSRGDLGYVGSQGIGYTGSAGESFSGTYTGTVLFLNSTTAIDPYTGAIVVSGGMGIQGPVYIASTTSYLGGALILTTATIAQYANTATGSMGVNSTSTLTVGGIVIGPGGYISFAPSPGQSGGDLGTYQYNRAPRHWTNYSDYVKEPFETWLPGDTYFEDSEGAIFIMVEGYPPVWDLPCTGNIGDSFITVATVPQIAAYGIDAIQKGMTVRASGVDTGCIVVGSDPLDPDNSPAIVYDGIGSYTIYLSFPNSGVVTSTSFTNYNLLDITFRAGAN